MRMLIFFLCFISSAYGKNAAQERGMTSKKELVPFSFVRKSLVDVIYFLSEKKKINILLPLAGRENEALKKQLVTFEPQGKTQLPLDQAWSLLTTFLELSGFSLVPAGNKLYKVTLNKDAGTETLPLYVGTAPAKLPKSEQRIRYIYYLRDIKVPVGPNAASNPLTKLFQDLLSPNSPSLFDPKSNSFLVVDRADIIASLLNVVIALDKSGYHEAIARVPLSWASVNDVVKVFDTLKKASGEQGRASIRAQPAENLAQFAQDTIIAGDPRTNSLILIGRQNNVDRITNFVTEYMDIAPESGKSILHTYDLQYLDAQSFAGVLQNIVSLQLTGTQSSQGAPQGAERFFRGIQIVGEGLVEVPQEFRTEEIVIPPPESGATEQIGIDGRIGIGGNRLIVAALQDDWLYLEDLIKKLDQPQPQVLVEVLVANFAYDHTKNISSTVRSKLGTTASRAGVQFLSSQISPANVVLGTTPTQLAQDLLAIIGPSSLPASLPQGTLLISLNDKATPESLALFKRYSKQLIPKYYSTHIF